MNRFRSRLLAAALILSMTALIAYFGGGGRAPAETPQDAQTRAVVEATTDFLKSLSDDQRKKVQFSFPTDKTATAARFAKGGGGKGGGGGKDGGDKGGGDKGKGGGDKDQGKGGGDKGKDGGDKGGGGKGGGSFVGEKFGDAVWSNFPTSDVPRPGLRLGGLNATQREAAMKLMQVVLSTKGYQKVIDIMGSDQVLADGGTGFSAGNDSYMIAVFGTPSATTPWMLQFGGHHLALNIVIAGERGVMTPTLTGAQPALYKSKDNKTVRPLGPESDKAFELLNSLDETQRKQAILNYRVGDLVLGPGHFGEKIQPEGLKVSSMNDKQREKLLDVVSEWAGIINDTYAKTRMEEIKAGLPDTYFAWSGPTTHEEGKNGSAYYRIQGPKIVIEYAPQGGGPGGPGMGGPTMHVHAIYRDPTNDYGLAYTAK
jgi:hypothetical protein